MKKVKFTDTAYELITRDLVDARLTLTFLKGSKTADEIKQEIRDSDGISFLNEEDLEIVKYSGYNDILVLKDYDNAVEVVLINNFLLTETMRLAGRVEKLEQNDKLAMALKYMVSKLEESQNNQDEVIAEILEII